MFISGYAAGMIIWVTDETTLYLCILDLALKVSDVEVFELTNSKETWGCEYRIYWGLMSQKEQHGV